jgi:pimeloyl-ACP methyl ester carboxylesterase
MSNNLIRYSKKVLLSAFAFLLSLQYSQSAGQPNPGSGETIVDRDSTIFQVTLRGNSYPFDHADYGLYVPKICTIRGVLILQHGCTMEQFGITRPYDLQYQAFAKKWHFAVLETALYGSCMGWKDAGSGSAAALLKALDDLGKLSGHSELSSAPWLLWGHSGGGYWTLSMIQAYPERILAAFCYSPAWEIPNGSFPGTVKDIPVFIRHAGSGEAPKGGSNCCWASSGEAFRALRKLNAPASIAYTAGQNHNYSFVRHMAVPFYEAVLKQRLPDRNQAGLRPLDHCRTWLGDTVTLEIFKETGFTGNKESLCLFPDSIVAAKWKEFVTTGNVADHTPPPAPFDLQATQVKDSVELSWKADADIESGIKYFNIYRNGELAGRFPKTGSYQTFDTNGDNTIPKMLADMKFKVGATNRKKTVLSVRTVNNSDLESPETKMYVRHLRR